MDEFDIDKFDSYLEEATRSADETRPAPIVIEPEPVVVKQVAEKLTGPEIDYVANNKGNQDTQYNNSVEEDFEPRFRADVGAAIKKALKDRMTRKAQIKHLQVKLGLER